MSISTVILGESGSGKTASLRNLNPADTLLIQVVKKPLPFRAKGWSYFNTESNKTGNIFVSDDWIVMSAIMRKTKRKVIIIDDFQYVLANEFMRRSDERGYDKFTEIAKHAWELFNAANTLADDVRVYLLSHTQTNDQGDIKLKTIGKMLDEKITPEGLFTIVLRTIVTDKDYFFSTRNNGHDTVKSPIGLFDSERVPNDLSVIDARISQYYELTGVTE
ncbi:AAA family ATPase [Glaciimonas sp. PCH181]|uniref:AAA family ATPase n=1 Tax=Glaciimonas sp. PCH181 TaxID=2133943 RepID=UPI000D3B1D6C|nr:AAA family ATPase [Glaciimonas sp. PCH181]PUA19614.1 ATP-binding protein [Glaciimonas sp. PCH181]